MTIRPILPFDSESVIRLYEEGLATGNATFQTTAPSWEEWDKSHLPTLRYMAVIEGENAGWIALSGVSSRCVYAGVAELSVYIGSAFRGKGFGFALMERIIAESEAAGYWTLQSSVFPENIASISLHHKCGFRTVGFREKVGQLNGVWRDTVLLERRSKNLNYY